VPPSAIREGHYVHDNGSAWVPDVDSDAVVRISLVHYNTVEQVDRIVGVLRKVLA
jgi:selenocysteine lyase/cysteine desulfurase